MSTVSSVDYGRHFCRYCSPLEPEPTGVPALLPDLNTIDAVLFDVYGTLVISSSGDVGTIMEDSAGDTFRSMVLREMDLLIPEDVPVDGLVKEEILKDHRQKKAGGTHHPEVEIRSIWKRVLRKIFADISSAQVSALAEEVALLHELSRNRVWPMPGSRELLELLRGRFRIGVVSNAQFYTPLMMKHFFGDSFSVLEDKLCIWSYCEDMAKPDPALFKKALANLGGKYLAHPSRVLYVGNDMLNDIAAASSLGMRTLLFAGDRRSLRMRNSDPRVSHIQPDGIVKDFDQMAKILGIGE
ncbi:HAD family hydrolase [Marispirochaeta aestuarii]|uniref:HAD family hydrolase n=1 Tax=Marispirochaeta aestuarii TaxID=1963862 RepID=UPI002ABD8BCB|nr:HAD family hydrolase [Marispirochaeta aestuarii]